MGNIIINMNTKEAEGSESLEVGDLKPTEASEKPGIDVKLDDSCSDVAAKAEDVSKDEEKTAEALSADEKAPVSVKVEASPSTEDALDNTNSDETAEEMAENVAKETDDYVTEGSDAKADDSSSLIQTERESQAPMAKDSSTNAPPAKVDAKTMDPKEFAKPFAKAKTHTSKDEALAAADKWWKSQQKGTNAPAIKGTNTPAIKSNAARKSILMKLAVAACKKGKRGKTKLYKESAHRRIMAKLAVAQMRKMAETDAAPLKPEFEGISHG